MSQTPGSMPMMMPGLPGGGASGSSGSKFTPVDPLRLLRQYKWLLVGAAVVGVVLGVVVFFLLRQYFPQYTSVANIEVTSPLTNPYAASNAVAPGQDSLEVYKQTQALYIMAPANLRAVLHRPDVQESAWFKGHFTDSQGNRDYDAAYEGLLKAISVKPIDKTQIIAVSATTSSPEQSEMLANAVVSTYLDAVTLNQKVDRTAIEQTFQARRNRLLDEIASLKSRADQIMDQSTLSTARTSFNEVEAVFGGLIKQQQEVVTQLNGAQQMLKSLQDAATGGGAEFSAEELATVDNDPAIRGVDARIMSLREERRVALQHFGPDHRTVTDIDSRIAAAQAERESKRQELLAQLQDVKLSQAQSQVTALQGMEANIEKQLVTVRQKRRELNRQLSSYDALQDQIKRQDTQLQALDDSLTTIELLRGRPDAIRVNRQGFASKPQGMSFPRAKIVVPGVAFLITALMAGLVFLKELLDNRIKSPSDVKLLPRADLLGVIPHATEDPNGQQEIELVVAHQPTGLLAENFRQLRTEVMNRMQKRRFRTMMVAGCEPSGGVTAITVNLACSLAMNDRKVLIIDANFRRPSLHTCFKLDKGPGLGDLLSSTVDVDAAIRATAVGNLDVITIGQETNHILEGIESDAFTQLLRKLEDRYELILIDAPPMSIVGDSRLMANRMDAVMLVVRAMQERRGLVSRVMNQLSHSRAEFMGLVLNGVRSSAGGYFRRNYQQFYEYQNGGKPAATAGRRAAVRS